MIVHRMCDKCWQVEAVDEDKIPFTCSKCDKARDELYVDMGKFMRDYAECTGTSLERAIKNRDLIIRMNAAEKGDG